MRRLALILLVGAGLLTARPGRAPAQVDARRAQVQAAETDAVESLRREVLAASVGGYLTVGNYLDQSNRHDALEGILKSATQIGGTRWIDDQTCIVRFELDGRRVADGIVGVAKSLDKDSPVPADEVARQAEKWSNKTFSATGTSTAARYIVDVRPGVANPAWRSVPDAESREALTAARSDAVRRVLDSLRSIPLGAGKTVADALEVPSVRAAVQDWLTQQPVVGLEFGDDLEVRMTIAAPAKDVWDVFRKALSAQQAVPAPSTEAEWARLHDDVIQRVARAVGRSYVPVKSGPTTTADRGPIELPARPPTWVYDPIDADGAAAGSARNLKTARLAEDDASAKLRAKLYAFRLNDELTVGDAARKDPRVEQAVTRSLIHARTYRVQWRDDGVNVRMTFDPRELWEELRSGQ